MRSISLNFRLPNISKASVQKTKFTLNKWISQCLGFKQIMASTDWENTASIRVMEKSGMKFTRREFTNNLDPIYYGISLK